jgi:quercetin dioxygenase-like cupin family protein
MVTFKATKSSTDAPVIAEIAREECKKLYERRLAGLEEELAALHKALTKYTNRICLIKFKIAIGIRKQMSSENRFRQSNLEDLEEYPDPAGPKLKVISWDYPRRPRGLGSKEVAMSMAILKPGESIEPHKHSQREEIYLLVKGRSQVLVDDKKPIDAEAYSFFRFGRDVMHSVRNNSSEDAHWIFVGAAATLVGETL